MEDLILASPWLVTSDSSYSSNEFRSSTAGKSYASGPGELRSKGEFCLALSALSGYVRELSSSSIVVAEMPGLYAFSPDLSEVCAVPSEISPAYNKARFRFLTCFLKSI